MLHGGLRVLWFTQFVYPWPCVSQLARSAGWAGMYYLMSAYVQAKPRHDLQTAWPKWLAKLSINHGCVDRYPIVCECVFVCFSLVTWS